MASEPEKEQERHPITFLMALEKSKERVRVHMIYWHYLIGNSAT